MDLSENRIFHDFFHRKWPIYGTLEQTNMLMSRSMAQLVS